MLTECCSWLLLLLRLLRLVLTKHWCSTTKHTSSCRRLISRSTEQTCWSRLSTKSACSAKTSAAWCYTQLHAQRSTPCAGLTGQKLTQHWHQKLQTATSRMGDSIKCLTTCTQSWIQSCRPTKYLHCVQFTSVHCTRAGKEGAKESVLCPYMTE